MNEEMERELYVCEHCGETIPADADYWQIEGHDGYICQDCLETLLDYGDIAYCDGCGELHDMEDLTRIENTGEYFCEWCLNRNSNLVQCYECDDWFDTTARNGTMYEVNDGDYVCSNCYDSCDYQECAECHGCFRSDDMYYDEDNEEWYCDSCKSDRRARKKIREYSYKPSPKFKASPHDEFDTGYNPKDPLYLGVELEIDSDCADIDAEDMAEEILDIAEDDVYCKHDGSLSGRYGVEIVTHPCTLAYHMEELGWDKITRKCVGNGYKSHDTSTCGLHIHVGRSQLAEDRCDQEDVIVNLYALLSAHKDNIIKFTRRKASALDRWAEMPDFEPDTPIEVYKEKASDRYQSRYQALNNCNRDTIEFRIFRGTLKKETLFAAFQFVSNMVGFAKAHTFTECHDSDWLDVMTWEKYPELNAYLEERDLYVNSCPWLGCAVREEKPEYPKKLNFFWHIDPIHSGAFTNEDCDRANLRYLDENTGLGRLVSASGEILVPGDVVYADAIIGNTPVSAVGIVDSLSSDPNYVFVDIPFRYVPQDVKDRIKLNPEVPWLATVSLDHVRPVYILPF